MTWIIVTGTLGLAAVLVIARAIYIHQLPPGRHQTPAPPPTPPPAGAPGYTFGSMTLTEERDWRARIRHDGIVWTDDTGDVHLKPWEAPHGAEAGAIWDKRATWNGHMFGCLRPDEDHWGACPEEGDDPNDPYDWPLPYLPDRLPAGPVDEDPGLVDVALALAADDPGDAGWTDQLLEQLRDAPTVLDRPPSRLADTGEIELAGQRADYAADLRAQDDDAAEFASRLAFDAASFQLQFNKPL